MRRLLQNAVWIFLFISFVYFPVTRGYAETPDLLLYQNFPKIKQVKQLISICW